MRSKYAFLGISFMLLSWGSFSQTFQTNGSWNTAANWNPASVPSGTGTDVTLGANPSLNSGANNVIGNVTVNNNVTLQVNANAVLTLGSSALFSGGTKKSMTFSNNGTIQVNSGSPDGVLEIWGDLIVNNNLTVQVTGSLIVHGNITMNNNATLQVSGGGGITVGGNLSGGSNTVIQVSGSGSTLAVTGSISVGGGSSSISVSGGGSISAGGGCTCTGCPANDGCSTDVLPVTLLFFAAQPTEGGVALNWATASELNFDYFKVERSRGDLVFSEIAQVQGNGTTTVRQDYSFEDRFPLIGKSYYRLTSVDFDGYTESFEVTHVVFTGTKAARVFPNPAVDGKINIELSFTPDEPVNVVATDLSGAQLWHHEVQSQATSLQAQLNPGTYLLKVSGSGLNTVLRVVVH